MLLLPDARNEVNNGLDGLDPLQLFSFSLLFPLIPRGPLVGGYPVDGDVERHGVHPSGASSDKRVFVLDAGAVVGDVVAHDEAVCVGAKGDEVGWLWRIPEQPGRDPGVPCIG